jgi:hypothetical protein
MIMQEPFELENNTEICSPTEDGQIPFDPEAAEGQRREAAKKKLSFAANRIGWATALLVGVWMGAIVIASVFAGFMGENGAVFYNRFYLILNEVTLAIGIAVALVVLLSV